MTTLDYCRRHGIVNADPEGCCPICGRVVDEIELEDGEEWVESEPRADSEYHGHSMT